ncbi:hypothetical protein A2U01_0021540 [Trifolium medium]|uniref:Uncharacterized protein n=1 Tax=Trifolium medium TaxID=97028 RepID=A0A392NMS1_9FABA|nr:hypothetical protein [Trifolium medium]
MRWCGLWFKIVVADAVAIAVIVIAVIAVTVTRVGTIAV